MFSIRLFATVRRSNRRDAGDPAPEAGLAGAADLNPVYFASLVRLAVGGDARTDADAFVRESCARGPRYERLKARLIERYLDWRRRSEER